MLIAQWFYYGSDCYLDGAAVEDGVLSLAPSAGLAKPRAFPGCLDLMTGK